MVFYQVLLSYFSLHRLSFAPMVTGCLLLVEQVCSP